jgi:hypothetical protein
MKSPTKVVFTTVQQPDQHEQDMELVFRDRVDQDVSGQKDRFFHSVEWLGWAQRAHFSPGPDVNGDGGVQNTEEFLIAFLASVGVESEDALRVMVRAEVERAYADSGAHIGDEESEHDKERSVGDVVLPLSTATKRRRQSDTNNIFPSDCLTGLPMILPTTITGSAGLMRQPSGGLKRQPSGRTILPPLSASTPPIIVAETPVVKQLSLVVLGGRKFDVESPSTHDDDDDDGDDACQIQSAKLQG